MLLFQLLLLVEEVISHILGLVHEKYAKYISAYFSSWEKLAIECKNGTKRLDIKLAHGGFGKKAKAGIITAAAEKRKTQK